MKLGLFNMNMGANADPQTAVAVAQAAEAAGFESLWAGEHVVLPEPQVPPSPLPPRAPILDPVVSLTLLAAHTTRVKLGTGIIILPQRNPLVLAKELASLDVVSNGRLVFGIGVGYLKPEFDALGIPFDHKGARTVDYLRAMLAIWTQEQPSHEGRFTSFAGVQAFPRPVQKPHPEIVFGGHTPEAFRRAIAHASGWYGFFQDLDSTARCIAGLKEAAHAAGRAGGLAGFEISITPPPGLDLDTARRYADLGVHRLIPFRAGGNAQDQLDFVAQTADALIDRV
jgi:probable F420-dependent oxidoreductase